MFSSIELLFYSSIEFQFDEMQNSKDPVNMLIVCVYLKMRKFMVHVLLKPGLENLSITLPACEMSAIVRQFEHSLGLPFLGIGTKIDLFQTYGHCCVFQICWHIECSTFTVSSFRI